MNAPKLVKLELTQQQVGDVLELVKLGWQSGSVRSREGAAALARIQDLLEEALRVSSTEEGAGDARP